MDDTEIMVAQVRILLEGMLISIPVEVPMLTY